MSDRRSSHWLSRGAIVRGDSIDMFRRQHHGATQDHSSIRPERLAAINVGFDHAIRRYWDLLAALDRSWYPVAS